MFVPLKPTEESMIVLSNLESESHDKMVGDCVHALVVLGQNRNPIKRTDLNKLAFPHNIRGKLPVAIVQAANKELNKTFGMRLYELEDRTKYLLVNSNPGFSNLIDHSDDTCSELTTLYFILLDIFASPDEKLPEEDIHRSLKHLDHNSASLKELLDLYVKKLYLVQDKDKQQQELKIYSWGPRAYAEIEPEGFFNCFLSLSGSTSSRDWPELEKRIEKLKNIANR